MHARVRIAAFILLIVASVGMQGCSTPLAIPRIVFANEQVRDGIAEAHSAMRVGNHQLAEEKFLATLTQAQAAGDEAGVAVIQARLGKLYLDTEKYKEAREALLLALSYFAAKQLRSVEAEVLGDIAFVEAELGNTEIALRSCDQSLTIWTELMSVAVEQEAQTLLKMRALTLFRKAYVHDKLADFGESVVSYRRAAQDYKSIGDRHGAGVALWLAAGIAERELKSQDEAITLYTEAVPLLLAANNHKEAAWASVSLGEMYVEIGKYADSREFLLNSMKLSESLHLPDVTFRARYALAKAFDNLGELDQALPHYEAVIGYIRKGEYNGQDDKIYLSALKRATFIYIILSKYDLAIEYARAAALRYRQRSDIENEIDTLAELTDLYVSLGDFETAIEYLRQIVPIIRKNRANSNDNRLGAVEAAVLAAIGDNLSLGGKTPAGEIAQYFQDARKSLTSYMGVDLLDEARKSTNLSNAQQSEPHEALKKSLASLDTNVRTIVRNMFSAWGRHSLKERELDTAISMFSIALACDYLSDTSTSPVELATMKIRAAFDSGFLADALRQKKDFTSALRFLSTAEKIATEFRSPLIHFVYAALGRTHADQGNFKDAVSYYKKGFQVLESDQYEQITDQKKIEAWEGASIAYRGLPVSLIEMFNTTGQDNYLREAFEYTERLRARTFLEILGNSKAARLGNDGGTLTSRQEKIRRQISFISDRLQNRKLDLKEAKNLLNQLEALHQEWKSVQRETAKQDSRYDQIVFPKPATISQVQAALSDDAVLLEYSISIDGSKLWAITREEVQVYNLPGEKSFPALDAFLRTLREPLMDAKEISEHIAMGNRLYQVLLEPAKRLIHAKKKLMIAPDGPLHYLPFEALIVPGPKNTRIDGKSLADIPYLITQAEVSYIPSASILVAQTKAQTPDQKPAQLPFVAFGDPLYGGTAASVGSTVPATLTNIALRGLNFNRLKFSEDEVLRIGRLWGVAPPSEHINLRERATVERVRDLDLTRYRVVHFATHAVLGDKVGMLSQPALVLSQTGSDEKGRGLLQFSDILELRLDADLVVLSACETGLGSLHQGEGIVGLTRAFFYAGATSAVVSLWKVEDQSTSLLMEKFYQWLKKGTNKADALRQAKLEILNSKIELKALGNVQSLASPFYWAPFILVGDPAPLRN